MPAFTQNFTADRSRFHEALYDDQIWGELILYQLGKWLVLPFPSTEMKTDGPLRLFMLESHLIENGRNYYQHHVACIWRDQSRTNASFYGCFLFLFTRL